MPAGAASIGFVLPKCTIGFPYKITIGSIRRGPALEVRNDGAAVPPQEPVALTGSPRMSKQMKSKPKQNSAKVDLNSATVDQLHEVRGIGKSRALEIVRYREKHGPFMSLDELGKVPHMGDMPWGELDEVKLHLTVRLAGDVAPPTATEAPKVDVNSANIEELRSVEGIGPERAQEIVDWREKYGRIRDINELDTLPHFKDEPEGQRGPIKARLRV